MLPRISSRPFRTLPSPLIQYQDHTEQAQSGQLLTERSYPGALGVNRTQNLDVPANTEERRPSFGHFFDSSSGEETDGAPLGLERLSTIELVTPENGTERSRTSRMESTVNLLGSQRNVNMFEHGDAIEHRDGEPLQFSGVAPRENTPMVAPQLENGAPPSVGYPQRPQVQFQPGPSSYADNRSHREFPREHSWGRPRGYTQPSNSGPPPPVPTTRAGRPFRQNRGEGSFVGSRRPRHAPYPITRRGRGQNEPPRIGNYPVRRPIPTYPPPSKPQQQHSSWNPPPMLPPPRPPFQDGPSTDASSSTLANTGPRPPPVIQPASKKSREELPQRAGTVKGAVPPPHTVPLPTLSKITAKLEEGAGLPKTFTRPVMPTELVDFPVLQNKNVDLRIWIGMPLYTGGTVVSGRLEVRIKGTQGDDLKVGRVSMDIVGVEELSFTRKHVFLSVASELIDDDHPPPPAMLKPIESERNLFWPVRPCRANIPFALELPNVVGPGYFYSARARIRYVIHGTIMLSINGQKTLVRACRDIRLLSTLPITALTPFAEPLIVMDERPLVFGKSQTVKVIAGLQRPTWVSGTTCFVDVSIQNNTRVKVRKIKLKLRRHVLAYKSVPTSSGTEPVHLRVPDWIDKKTLSHSELNVGTRWRGTRENSIDVLTCEVEIPRQQVSVKLGRLFEVRYFVDVVCKTAVGTKVEVQLPITIVHMNSLEEVPTTTVNDAHLKKESSEDGVALLKEKKSGMRLADVLGKHGIEEEKSNRDEEKRERKRHRKERRRERSLEQFKPLVPEVKSGQEMIDLLS